MIGYLEGKIIHKSVNYIILKVGEVGYKVFVIPTEPYLLNTKTEVFIYEDIKEEKHDLYGFKDQNRLSTFEKLISVSGLGPKIAITILSSMTAGQISKSIDDNDTNSFLAIKGIGKKLANKIILELKDKIDISDLGGASQNTDRELIEALESLGYGKKEIEKIIKEIPKDILTIEDKIKWSLKRASK